ncbi:MAG TPA: 4-hydroxybenzoate octaprenyltransferase [Methylophilaceae bacterium]|nr:4-hydroxybenzoate octaprenyltransferase [Methylophilaceae bacterium]
MNRQQIKNKLDAYERLMRLDRPIGILLLLWPTLWALWLAGKGHPNPMVVWIFILGTILMRSAGCVMNDLADRDFDGYVERTQFRPLATGEVHTKEARLLATCLSLIAFVMVLFLNKLTISLSFIALALAMTYPLTKRFIAIPQAYLGMAFGFGIPMAYAALTNTLPLIVWALMAANLFWVIAYDTEYAMVDREDDLKIGIKSSAIFFGRYEVVAIMACYALMLGILLLIGIWQGFLWPYYLGLVSAGGIMLYHYRLIRTRDRNNCFRAFLHNNWVGASVFIGIIASSWLKYQG